MNIDSLILELGQQMGAPELRLGEDRSCTLRFGAELFVVIEAPAVKEEVYLYGVAGSYSSDVKPEYLLQLLDANFFGRKTDPGYLAVRRDSNEILFIASFQPEKTSYIEFAALLESFVNRLETLQRDLDPEAASENKTAPEPAEFSLRV